MNRLFREPCSNAVARNSTTFTSLMGPTLGSTSNVRWLRPASPCSSYLPHPYCQRFLGRRQRREFHGVGSKLFSGSAGLTCLPASGGACRPEKSGREPMAVLAAFYRRARSFRRKPVVFRRRAVYNGDGARRPVETPRSFRWHRPEPTAHRGCLCPTKGGSGTCDSNRNTKQGFFAGGFR